MNNDIETRAYPCDEPEAKRSYPCDTDGEAFSYAQADNASDQSETPVRKGKGRRGGNASASVVIHSGRLKTVRENGRRDDADRRTEYAERRSSRYDSSERSGRDSDRNRGEYRDSRSGYDRRERDDRRGDDRRNERFGDESRSRRFGDRSSDRDRFGRDSRGTRGNDERRDGRSGGRSFESRRDNRSDRRGRDDRRSGDDRRYRGERGQNPESVFSRAYNVRVVKTSEVGAFVEAPEDIVNGAFGRKLGDSRTVLLPFSEQLGRPVSGDNVRVYFYEDKGGRMTATMRTPILKDGEVGILTVAAATNIGAFLDNGVPKQVLLPFKEQITAPKEGDEVLVWLYSDKSGRQAATMRVYGHLDKHSPYKEDDRVTGFVYEINPKLGIFVAVDNKYYGLVPMNETFKEYEYGDEVEARVAKVREDGKLDLLIRDKLYKTVNEDADVILYELRRNNGFLPYGDRADAEFIEETYAMSKNQFKRALGHLYKNHVVELDREKDTVRLIKQ